MTLLYKPLNDEKKLPLINLQHHHLEKKYALVVEGGGMRGIFSAGVLDSFYNLNFDPFHLYLGVSAGSLNLISHLACQYLRNYHVIMFCATSGKFINGWKYFRGGHYVDLDWLGNECLASYPLDQNGALQRLKLTGKKFIIVCTNIETGQANYYYPDEKNIHDILLGSCCLPLFYRNPVFVAGIRIIDGGISDPIPVKKAYAEGATDIVIIRTRAINYRAVDDYFETILGYYMYRNYPQLQKSILNLSNNYNNSVEFIENPPPGVNIYQIAPKTPLCASLTTTDPQLLETDYQLGRELGKNFIQDWSGDLSYLIHSGASATAENN